MPRQCTCPRDGSYYCDWCVYIAQRAGLALPGTAAASRFVPLGHDAPEGELQNRAHKLCVDLGYLYQHLYSSKRSTPGWLDTAIVHPAGSPLYLWEFKSVDGDLSPAQQRWLAALRRATSIETAVYRPADWPTIVAILTKGAQT